MKQANLIAMNCNSNELEQLVHQMQQTDFTTASPAKVQAMVRLLRAVETQVTEAPSVLAVLEQAAQDRFRHGATYEEKSSWLEILLLTTDEENLFADCLDDTEYEALQEQKDFVFQQWKTETLAWIDGAVHTETALSLEERLHLLWRFYWQDIHTLSEGDDHRAHALMGCASAHFEQCQTEVLRTSASLPAFLFHYHVLCLAHPGHRHSAHAAYYQQYFCRFEGLVGNLHSDSDWAWQAKAIEWHHRMEVAHHYDLSLLPDLSFIVPQACAAFRRQCYQWLLDLDPDDDDTTSTLTDQHNFIRQGISRICAWLKSKEGRVVPTNKEAEALLTLSCAKKHLFVSTDLDALIIRRAYALLPQLPPSKQKAHLLVHLALDTDDDTLLAEADAIISTWNNQDITEEDRYLQEYYQPQYNTF